MYRIYSGQKRIKNSTTRREHAALNLNGLFAFCVSFMKTFKCLPQTKNSDAANICCIPGIYLIICCSQLFPFPLRTFKREWFICNMMKQIKSKAVKRDVRLWYYFIHSDYYHSQAYARARCVGYRKSFHIFSY